MSSSYEESGVSIHQGNSFVDTLKSLCRETYHAEVKSGIGGFSALYRLPHSTMILSASTDGVGTKILLANQLKSVRGLGIDLVAMVMNDVIVCGAKPLFLLDYYALSNLPKNFSRSVELMEGIKDGCLQADCSLIGGETAEMPDVYSKERFDLAGFGIGIVDEKDLLGSHRVQRRDVIIGLASSGPHSNGYSLIRKAFKDYAWDRDTIQVKEQLLAPTIIYEPVIRKILSNPRHGIHAMAHITGGGLEDNIQRSVPEGMEVIIDWEAWERPEIFTMIAGRLHIEESEMRQVFNCGIGFALIVDSSVAFEIINTIQSSKLIGYIQ